MPGDAGVIGQWFNQTVLPQGADMVNLTLEPRNAENVR
jgi:hypothetical protein